MARLLYRVGQWSAVHRGRVVVVWLLLLVLAVGLGTGLHGRLSSVFTVPGTQSQAAQDLLQREFPAAAGGTARIVFAAPNGTTLISPRTEKAISTSLAAAARVPGVVGVSDPFGAGSLSANKTVAYSDVLFRELGADVPPSVQDRLGAAMAPARLASLQVDFSGTAFAAEGKVEGAGEVSGIVIAFAVLAIALGSLIAAGLPLLTALTGVAIGVLFVGFLARFIQMTDTASVLATMLGLAVGIDYALFIVSRHREQLARPGQDVTDSIARAIGTAGSSVVFAGSTVIVALAALSLAGIPFLTVMGLAAAGTVTLAVLAAVSLVPALLGLAGEQLRPGAARRPRRGESGRWGLAWARLAPSP
jgi:RND superfamily putative drug exporter